MQQTDQVKSEIMVLSQRYCLSSQYTSFVAVSKEEAKRLEIDRLEEEKREEERRIKEERRRQVEVEEARKRHRRERCESICNTACMICLCVSTCGLILCCAGATSAAPPEDRAIDRQIVIEKFMMVDVQPQRATQSSALDLDALVGSLPAIQPSAKAGLTVQSTPPSVTSSAEVKLAPFDALVRAQQFDGSWLFADVARGLDAKDTDGLRDVVTYALREVAEKHGSLTEFESSSLQNKQPIDALVGTLLALAVLDKKFSARKPEWSLLAIKARAFLSATLNKMVAARARSDSQFNAADWCDRMIARIAEQLS